MKKRVTVALPIQGLLPTSVELDSKLKNVIFPQNGTVATRWPIAPMLADNSLASTQNFQYFEGASVSLVSGGKIYNNSTLLKQLTKKTQTYGDMTEANGYLFIAPDWDGASEVMQVIEPTTHTIRDTTAVVDEVNTKLKPGLIENHKGVMFAARITESDGFHPTRIRWSDFATPENFSPWGAGNFQSFEDVGEPYDEIIRIVSLGNDLIIFKQRSIWVASGTQSDIVAPEYIRQLSDSHCLVGPQALAKTPDGIVFLTLGGIYLFNGSTFKEIGKEIWQYLGDRIQTYWGSAALGYDTVNKNLYVAVPDAHNYNEDCFVKTDRGWTRFVWPLRPTCFRMYDEELIIGMSEHGTYHQIYNDVHDHVQTGTTAAIAGVWATDWLDLRYPMREKLMRTVELTMSIQSALPEEGITLTVENFYDYGTVAKESNTLDMSASNCRGIYDGDRLTGIKWFFDIDGSCRKVRFVFSGTGMNVLFEIMEVSCSFIPRGGN